MCFRERRDGQRFQIDGNVRYRTKFTEQATPGIGDGQMRDPVAFRFGDSPQQPSSRKPA